MKNLKLTIATLLLTAGISNIISAQAEVKSGPLRPVSQNENQYQENKDRLGITSEQQMPFKEISKRYAVELKELRASDMTKEMKIQKVKAIMDRKAAEMKTILNSEQFKVYQQMQEERKIKMTERRSKQ